MGESFSKPITIDGETGIVNDKKALALQLALRVGSTALLSFLLFKYLDKLRDIVDPTRKQKKIAEEKAFALLKKFGKKDIKAFKLNEYELNVASHLVIPSTTGVSWDEIGGLDDIIEEIKETVILPFKHQDIFQRCKLFQPPKGILLYGPPGCGKTMLAKATARAANCAFLNIEIQQLTDKWYGESQKLAAAVFSLAHKLQPAIIFIDEIDVFLQARSDKDHEATAMMKATFMSLWDGLATNKSTKIMVMGATNRAHKIDQAILRRLPIRLHVPLPNAQQRERILSLVLDGENLALDVALQELSEQLHGFSGSDISEMCRYASVARVHEHIRRYESENITQSIRPINMADLLKASQVMQRSKGAEAPYLFPNSLLKAHGEPPE